MSPEEKAKQLLEKYHLAMYSTHDPNATTVCYLHSAKPCALLAVSEILSTLNEMEDPSIFIRGICENNIDYWMQVKDEIQKH